jgi:hypothetical protein
MSARSLDIIGAAQDADEVMFVRIAQPEAFVNSHP